MNDTGEEDMFTESSDNPSEIQGAAPFQLIILYLF